MQSGRDVLSASDVAVHKSHVVHAVERRNVGKTPKGADLGRELELAGALDQLVAVLPLGDQIRDRELRQIVLFREGCDFRPPHHRTVVVHKLGQHADPRQRSETA